MTVPGAMSCAAASIGRVSSAARSTLSVNRTPSAPANTMTTWPVDIRLASARRRVAPAICARPKACNPLPARPLGRASKQSRRAITIEKTRTFRFHRI